MEKKMINESFIYNNPRKIAILMAAYNAEQFIAEQIDSILNQSYSNWTLYIRNDASKDHTGKIISDYCLSYPDRIIEVDLVYLQISFLY